jgi:hypothetical protein
VCYDKRHNTTLAEVNVDKVADVFNAWRADEEFEAHPISTTCSFSKQGETGFKSASALPDHATDLSSFIETTEVADDHKKRPAEISSRISLKKKRRKIRIVAEIRMPLPSFPFSRDIV